MFKYSAITVGASLLMVSFIAAEEIDAVINDGARSFTRNFGKNSEKFYYSTVRLDSQGKVVSSTIKDGLLTKSTRIVMGKFDEKKEVDCGRSD